LHCKAGCGHLKREQTGDGEMEGTGVKEFVLDKKKIVKINSNSDKKCFLKITVTSIM
jgi:hypothetical protein